MKSWSVRKTKARFIKLLKTRLREGPQKPTLKALLLSDLGRADLVIPDRGARRRRNQVPLNQL